MARAARSLPPLLFQLRPPARVPGPWSGCRISWAPGSEGPRHASVSFCGSERAVSVSPDSRVGKPPLPDGSNLVSPQPWEVTTASLIVLPLV